MTGAGICRGENSIFITNGGGGGGRGRGLASSRFSNCIEVSAVIDVIDSDQVSSIINRDSDKKLPSYELKRAFLFYFNLLSCELRHEKR